MIQTLHCSRMIRAAALPVVLLLLAGCGRGGNAGGPPGANAGPVEVTVATIAADGAVFSMPLPARVNPVREAQVRARVTGIVLKRRFEEGADVAEGQLLFEIDPAPCQAAYDSAKASLARAEALREQAQAQAKRDEALVKINGVSQQAFETAKAAALEAQADVLAAQAALETAALNLGYTKVTAPISGRIGQALVTEGALASASDATEMAVIRQLDPVYVDATQSSAERLQLRRAVEAAGLSDAASRSLAVAVVLEDGSLYPHPGKTVFQDAAMDEQTGTVMVRAEVPNPEKSLLPGMFVRARVEVAQPQAITVLQRAVARDATSRTSVLLVNAQDQVEQRFIQTTALWQDKWIVSSGLSAGDRVIVEGLQKVRVGAAVKALPFVPGAATNAIPASAPAAAK